MLKKLNKTIYINQWSHSLGLFNFFGWGWGRIFRHPGYRAKQLKYTKADWLVIKNLHVLNGLIVLKKTKQTKKTKPKTKTKNKKKNNNKKKQPTTTTERIIPSTYLPTVLTLSSLSWFTTLKMGKNRDVPISEISWKKKSEVSGERKKKYFKKLPQTPSGE